GFVAAHGRVTPLSTVASALMSGARQGWVLRLSTATAPSVLVHRTPGGWRTTRGLISWWPSHH
ncbi:MAG: hypothetical protein LC776_03045, partial [Acidobacteria bacterium]|nr:hypothetical protein [Acidobacteriota bacterium]